MKAVEKPQVIIYTTLLILLALIVLVLSMSGCINERIEGNHDLITQERDAQPFSEVISSGSFSIKIIPSSETRIEVKGESNILPYLSTISNGTTLTVQFNNGYSIHEHYPVEVFLYTPFLQAVRLSGSGKGFFSEPYEVSDIAHTSYSYAGGYGGILIEPILFPKYPVHVSFPILLGGGGIARSVLYNYYYPYEYTEVFVENAEAFLIAEPGIEIEFNVARWMRLGLGASYRLTTVFEPSSFETNPLNGFTGGFSLKFGKF